MQIGATAFFERVRETAIVSDRQGQAMNRAYREPARPGGIRQLMKRLRPRD